MKVAEAYYKRTNRKHLYNIMPLQNISSVIQNGILSYDSVKSLSHGSIAMSDVQTKRDMVTIPKSGNRLHSYANLYFTHHNPMLFKRKDQSEDLCILVLSADVLDIEGCIVTDQNAASRMVMFYDPIEGIDKIDFDIVFMKYWVDETDEYRSMRQKRIKCAEVLVPNSIPYDFIVGAIVVSESAKQNLESVGFDKKIVIDKSRFYQ